MSREQIRNHRDFLKDKLRLTLDFRRTDQSLGLAAPPLQKPADPGQLLQPLPGAEAWNAFSGTDLVRALKNRRSRREFLEHPLSLAEVAFLLWATQGLREVIHPGCALRTVPSAGCRHAFETYLLVSRVEGLDPGIYRYLPIDHVLALEQPRNDFREELAAAVLHQGFVAEAPVTFAWTALPYRMEWRYDLAAHRVILMDAGHLCQNLYLACEAIHAGTCAVAAYHQEKMDHLLGVDGEEEFTLYLSPVGKIPAGR